MKARASGRTVMDAKGVRRALKRIAQEILDRNGDARRLALVGVRTRGVFIAERLCGLIEAEEGQRPQMGIIDIGLYRDDLNLMGGAKPIVGRTEIDFPVEEKILVLTDDVLFTGRTVRAALDAIMDFGRPKAVQLAVLVDRGCRELPITADYTGRSIETGKGEEVIVRLEEMDGEDSVSVRRRRTGAR